MLLSVGGITGSVWMLGLRRSRSGGCRMARSGRQRAAALDRVLENHAAWERRTLADLRVLGFKFQTVEQAFRYRDAQRTLARMSSDELVELVDRMGKKK